MYLTPSPPRTDLMSGVPAAERAGSLGGGSGDWPLMVMVEVVPLVLVVSPAMAMVVQCSGEPPGSVLMFTRL